VVDDVARQEVGTPPTLLAQLCATTQQAQGQQDGLRSGAVQAIEPRTQVYLLSLLHAHSSRGYA
jgi:hypothetical protein